MQNCSICRQLATGKSDSDTLRSLKTHVRNSAVLLTMGASLLFAQVQPGPDAPPLMPWPAQVNMQTGTVAIDTQFSISTGGAGATDSRVQEAVQRTFTRLSRQTGMLILPHIVTEPGAATLRIIVEGKDHRAPQRLGDDERYSLEASGAQVRLSADAPLGALRGLETFLQLVGQNTSGSAGFSVPAITIHDEPRFPWRGLSLDVSRHFIPVDGVKRTIDGLAAVKLNVFHWHLSDDQGFRVESKKFPRLQQMGSDGQFYAQAEIRDVVAYARERGVRVVPEFDIPGHATSWLPGYPALGSGSGPYEIVRGHGILTALLDPTKEGTYRFLNTFVGEMVKLFPDEYFHIGGDEVNPQEWNSNPRIQRFMKKQHLENPQALQAYFNRRLLKIVAAHGKHMEGWDEILHPELPKSIVIQSWRGQESLWQAANEGYQGILSAGYYLDLMRPASYHYAIDPLVLPTEVRERMEKKGNPVPVAPGAEQSKNILGGEAAMWEELASPENLDSRLWPRLAVIAERFWSPQPVTDVSSMYARLAVTNRWLEWLGLTQRSDLALMRERLAGLEGSGPLALFDSVLEPVKGYSRHAEKYSTFTPLNRLVDATQPESDAAREFNGEVDRFVGTGRAHPEAILLRLSTWEKNAEAVLPILKANSLLNEDVPTAVALLNLCKYGQVIAGGSEAGGNQAATLRTNGPAILQDAETPKADLLIQIAPGIRKLAESGGGTQSASRNP